MVSLLRTHKITILFICILAFSLSYAQNEAAHWKFGRNFSMSFNSGVPETTNLDFPFATVHKPAIISDKNGCFQFYSSGGVIYGKDGELMPNGTGILGSIGSAGIIIPLPGSDSIYYYIYNRCNDFCEESSLPGSYYSIIDMSLNDGNGDVVLKNIKFSDNSPQSYEAVRSPDSNTIWMATYINTEQEIRVYEFNEQGFNLNYQATSVDNVEFFGLNYFSRIQFSNQGDKLVTLTYNNGAVSGQEVFLFDFNPITGTVSNQISLGGVAAFVFSVEFSPNSNLLYFVTNPNINSIVYQLDISSNSVDDILSSLTEIHFNIVSGSPDDPNQGGLGSIALGPDGKIYIVRTSIVANYLDVIHNPNGVGEDCDYEEQGVIAEEDQFQIFGDFHFPSFVRPYNIDLSIDVEDVCSGLTRTYDINSTYDILSAEWDFGDGNTSTEITPTHTYESGGVYIVTVTITTTNEVRTITKRVIVYDSPELGEVSDYNICDDDSNDGLAIFDMITKNEEILNGQSPELFEITYFANIVDLQANENEVLPLNYTNEANNQTIYAKVSNKNNPRCYGIAEFKLVVNEVPILSPIETAFFACGEVNESNRVVNLDQFNHQFLADQDESDFNFKYFLTQGDAENNSNELNINYEMENNQQTLFVRIENSDNEDCYKIQSFDIVFEERPIAFEPDDIYICDIDNNIVEQIDLSILNPSILNGQSVSSNNITYYSSFADAEEGQSPLSNSYTISSLTEQIFARIESINNSECYDITSFSAHLISTPDIGENELIYVCPNELTILEVEGTYDSYLWSTGQTSSSIEVTEAGTYTVTVFQNNATIGNNTITCEATKEFVVIESDVPEFIEVTVNDLSSNNSIEIYVEGLGDYEFSLDGLNYQDGSKFENLRRSEYTIFIRDKNGCGVVTEDVQLLISPRYFTPNADGVNDYWQLKSAFSEPDLDIQIYDRYGKLLVAFSGSSTGWDGTFGGQRLPANDYWYKIYRPNNQRTYVGHFTLKR